MDTLSAWTSATHVGADRALARLEDLACRGEVAIYDAAILTWREDHRKPAMRELGRITGPGVLWRGFWGMFFGLLFLVPIAGLALGAAAGAVMGGLTAYGISAPFVREARATIVPGTSALFVLSDAVVADRLAAEFADLDLACVRCDLSEEQAAMVRGVLADEATVP